jgi:hypothetical protein
VLAACGVQRAGEACEIPGSRLASDSNPSDDEVKPFLCDAHNLRTAQIARCGCKLSRKVGSIEGIVGSVDFESAQSESAQVNWPK